MPTVNRLYCCGWREISGLAEYAGNFDDILINLIRMHHIGYGELKCGAFIFTEAYRRKVEMGYASRFAADIKLRKLGKITELPIFRNPNTGNSIRTFMWQPSAVALHRYCEKYSLYKRGGVW